MMHHLVPACLRNDSRHNSTTLSSAWKLVRHFDCENFPVLKVVKGKGKKHISGKQGPGTGSSVSLLHIIGKLSLLLSSRGCGVCARLSKEDHFEN